MKYIAVAVLLAALGYGAVRVNRRLTPARPSPRTLAERYGWEMEGHQAMWPGCEFDGDDGDDAA